jgi:hypothetical protein
MNNQEKALDIVNELFKLIPATAGVMLALIWGLAGDSTPHDVLVAIRIASIVLVASIVVAILGLQFVVSGLQEDHGDPAIGEAGRVQLCFGAAWLLFLAGCGGVIWSLFLL